MALADEAGGHPVTDVFQLAVVVRLRLDEVDPRGKILGLRQEGKPAGGIAGGAPQDGVGVTAEPDRQVRLLDAFWFERNVLEGHILALELGVLLGP